MQSGGYFTCSEQSGYAGHLSFGVHPYAAHDVMRRRSDFHRLLSDVKVGELHKLMIHARQLPLNMFRRVRDFLLDPRNVEKYAAMGRAAAGLNLVHDAA